MGLNPELLWSKKKDEIMEVNILAFIATALFILVPTAFLLIIYVKTETQNKNKKDWLIWMKLDFWVLIKDWIKRGKFGVLNEIGVLNEMSGLESTVFYQIRYYSIVRKKYIFLSYHIY